MNSRNIIHAIARIVVLVPVLGAIIATGTGSLVGLDGALRNGRSGGAFVNSFEHGPQGG